MPDDPNFNKEVCSTLIHALADCERNGKISGRLRKRFIGHHLSTVHKISAAQYFRDKIRERIDQPMTDIYEALFEMNLYLDGYLYNFKSSVDILSQEINVLYGLRIPKERVEIFKEVKNLSHVDWIRPIVISTLEEFAAEEKEWLDALVNFKEALVSAQKNIKLSEFSFMRMNK